MLLSPLECIVVAKGSVAVLLLLKIIRWAILHCWEFLYLNYFLQGKYEK